ncbi:MAG: hypothetical protein K0S45_3567 [Nitrospira sp.]|nr:hypothetical protein [Nitrospira sp.]
MQRSRSILPHQHVQEAQKVGAGMACATLAHDRAGGSLQRGVETRQAVPTIVMGLSGRHARPQ